MITMLPAGSRSVCSPGTGSWRSGGSRSSQWWEPGTAERAPESSFRQSIFA